MGDFPLWKYGRGEITLVLVHGGPSLSRYMNTLGEILQGNYSIIEYQQYGTPEVPTEDITLQILLDQLKEVLREAPKNRILVGHSWGATLINLYLKEHDEKAVFFDPAPLSQITADQFGKNLRSRMSDDLRKKLDQIKADSEQTTDPDKIQSLMQLRLDFISPYYHSHLSTDQKLGSLEWDYHSFLKIMDEAWELIDQGELHAREDIPTLHGADDPIPFLKRAILIPTAGHFPWLEADISKSFAAAVKGLR